MTGWGDRAERPLLGGEPISAFPPRAPVTPSAQADGRPRSGASRFPRSSATLASGRRADTLRAGRRARACLPSGSLGTGRARRPSCYGPAPRWASCRAPVRGPARSLPAASGGLPFNVTQPPDAVAAAVTSASSSGTDIRTRRAEGPAGGRSSGRARTDRRAEWGRFRSVDLPKRNVCYRASSQLPLMADLFEKLGSRPLRLGCERERYTSKRIFNTLDRENLRTRIASFSPTQAIGRS
ncbi:hypothetical protein MTDSW087_05896 [Methylobacterium dankookense]|uniref:Uncharacterized protein n=1 Tax=Methylobacterium dankookense TaxID=560405 RepID=A0A564G6H7_9HYPH|nr:hypothetical protein IFDJLNFL_2147 [Methylobacterium dankookense]VUF16139.1 hypothetical protein MTDSW087_05896 [Methylobacterium dankookense]